MISTLNFREFLHTMYKYVVKISMMFAKYFKYYTIILRGAFFVDKLYKYQSIFYNSVHNDLICSKILIIGHTRRPAAV